MEEKCSINIWINEERDEMLRQAGLANLAQDALARMKVLQLYCTKEQKDRILKLYPMAKYDSATTKSIELLPAEIKNELFNLIIKNKSLDIVNSFLKN
ncbi:hypothetical protein ES705_16936 [subsurface metagenome]